MVPMPSDRRLRRVCDALLANPESAGDAGGLGGRGGRLGPHPGPAVQAPAQHGICRVAQRVRFHNAVEALAAGEPIGQVARDNGYRSASAFSAAFRKAMGMAPSAIRVAA